MFRLFLICPIFDCLSPVQFTKHCGFLWVCWFLAKNLVFTTQPACFSKKEIFTNLHIKGDLLQIFKRKNANGFRRVWGSLVTYKVWHLWTIFGVQGIACFICKSQIIRFDYGVIKGGTAEETVNTYFSIKVFIL